MEKKNVKSWNLERLRQYVLKRNDLKKIKGGALAIVNGELVWIN